MKRSAKKWQKPTIEELLLETGLARYVNVHREHTGYNWFLQKEIYSRSNNGNCSPIYDFCFIDGAKNWTIDGAAFFLVDKLLKEKGILATDRFITKKLLLKNKTNKNKKLTRK